MCKTIFCLNDSSLLESESDEYNNNEKLLSYIVKKSKKRWPRVDEVRAADGGPHPS